MQLTIGALRQAASWPGTGPGTRVVLASQLVAAGLYQEGLEYSRPARTPHRPMRSGGRPSGAVEFRLDGRTGRRSPSWTGPRSRAAGLVPGASLARLPRCAGRAETVAGDLEFVLAAKDQFPPGSMRAAQERWTVSTNDQGSAP
jgi:hypothetical protein